MKAASWLTCRVVGALILAAALALLPGSAAAEDLRTTFSPPQRHGAPGVTGALVSADFNHDLAEDLAAVASHPGGTDDVVVLLSIGGVDFGPAATYAGGSGATSMAAGDVNGDGEVDLVTTEPGGVAILLGTGTGTFEPAVFAATGDDPIAVALASMNGDSALDLVVANPQSDTVSILMGNGDASFGPPTSYGVKDHPVDVAVSKRTGDIFAVSTVEDKVTILVNRHDGTFSRNSLVDGGGPVAIATGDLDVYQLDDFATAGRAADVATVYSGFGEHFGRYFNSGSVPVADQPVDVAIGYLQNSGNPDMVTADLGSGDVSFMSGHGDTGFDSGVGFPAGGVQSSVVVTYGRYFPGEIAAVLPETGEIAVLYNEFTGPAPDRRCAVRGAIVGTESDDVLVGTPGPDVICGLYGFDRIKGRGGNDLLIGGPDGDTLIGNEGADRLEGGDYDDTLDGGAGADTVLGGAGVDVLSGAAGDDHLDGGTEGDRLFGGVGDDQLYGRMGDDVLTGQTGLDRLLAGTGDDVIHSSDGIAEEARCSGGVDTAEVDVLDTTQGCEAVTVR